MKTDKQRVNGLGLAVSSTTNSRRRIIMMSAVAISAAVVGKRVSATETAGMLEESDETAIQLGYKKQATEVDTVKFPKRAGDEGAKQFCSNCQFFSAIGEDQSPCVVFGGKQVAATGWCNSWFERA